MYKSIWAKSFLCTLSILPLLNMNVNAQSTNIEITKPYKVVTTSDREVKNLYNEKADAVQVFNASGRKFYMTNKDIDLMARVVYAESNAEPYEGKIAVASVILNRLENPKFPKTVEGVITQKNAFSCVKNGRVNASPDKTCYQAVYDAIDGKDPTPSALFFYNPRISTSSWMKNIKKENIRVIGNHVFFVDYR
ncbi:MAG: cell wall hydrolase [Bacillota bacterium]|nr:cell wall hydrolase [Bacillota bacterium]